MGIPGKVGKGRCVRGGSGITDFSVVTRVFGGLVAMGVLPPVLVGLSSPDPWPPVGIPEIAGQGGSVSVRTWVSPPSRVMVVVMGIIVRLAMGVIFVVP